MTLLLDTHVLLWWLADDRTLKAPARRLIADSSNKVVISAATVWEIAIKRELGKLTAPADLLEQLDSNRFSVLALSGPDLWLAGHLPSRHTDPFDRAILAQAIRSGFRILTRDTRFAEYGADTVPA